MTSLAQEPRCAEIFEIIQARGTWIYHIALPSAAKAEKGPFSLSITIDKAGGSNSQAHRSLAEEFSDLKQRAEVKVA